MKELRLKATSMNLTQIFKYLDLGLFITSDAVRDEKELNHYMKFLEQGIPLPDIYSYSLSPGGNIFILKGSLILGLREIFSSKELSSKYSSNIRWNNRVNLITLEEPYTLVHKLFFLSLTHNIIGTK